MSPSIGEILAKPTSAGRYLSASELDSIQSFVRNGGDRLAVARLLQSKSTELVAKSLRILLEDRPNLVDTGGSLNDHSALATYINQLDILLRFIAYSAVAGQRDPLGEWLHDLRSRYISMGLSIGLIVSAVRLLQTQTLEEIDLLQIKAETKELICNCFIDILSSLT